MKTRNQRPLLLVTPYLSRGKFNESGDQREQILLYHHSNQAGVFQHKQLRPKRQRHTDVILLLRVNRTAVTSADSMVLMQSVSAWQKLQMFKT